MKQSYISFAIVVLAIPVILNFLLPINTGLNIIGGKESVGVWMSFWGAYLAALGTFALGWVSYEINKKAIEQNEKILHNYAWDNLAKRYEHLERYIGEQEKIHNESSVKKLFAILSKYETANDCLIYLYHQKQEISLTSLYIIRFLEQQYGCDFHNETGWALNMYGAKLKEANIAFIKLFDTLIKELENNQSDDFSFDIISQEEKVIESKQNTVESCQGLITAGSDLLKAEKERIRGYARKHKIEQGIL